MTTFKFLKTNRENHFVVYDINHNGKVTYGGLFVTGSRGEEQLAEMVDQYVIDKPDGSQPDEAMMAAFGITETTEAERAPTIDVNI